MKKLALGIVGLVIVLIAAVIVGPGLMNWNGYKVDIAQAVKDATGRDLKIDGDIELSLVPSITISVGGIRLANAPGMKSKDMLSIKSIAAKIGLFPLIGRRVVVDSFVISGLAVNLEVDAKGKQNWVFDDKPGAASPAAKSDPPGSNGGGLPISDLQLGDVRLVNGSISYLDAGSGQSVVVKNINLKVALQSLAGALSLTGDMNLNDKPVKLDARIDPVQNIISGERFAANFGITSEMATVSFDGKVLQKPVPGLDGSFGLDVPSVGKLAAWLGRPLDSKQPDPGPLKVEAKFTGEGAKITLKSVTIEGAGLKAEASGSFDGSGAIKKIVLDVKSGKLDIDKYLPPVEDAKASPPGKAENKGDPLAGLPTTPIDLSILKGTEADVNIAIGGVKVRGFEVGRIALTTRLKGGKLEINLAQLALYGGTIGARITLDGSGNDLGLDANLKVATLDIGKLAKAVIKDGPAVGGIANATLVAKARGVSVRDIVENLSGKLSLDLGKVDVKEAPITALKVDFDLPGLTSPPSLKASVVYNKERVSIDARLDPLKKILAGERFAVKFTVTSRLLKAGYDGDVLQKPVPGLDGNFDLDVASVGKLAAWLGRPLDAKQPDPGPLRIKAVFAGEGAKVTLKSATIQGKALRAEASGSFDGSGAVKKIVLDIKAGKLDIDKYLPPVDEASAAPAGPQQQGDPLAGLPTEPIDLSALKGTEADVSIAIGGIKVRGFEVGRIALTTRLKDGKLNLTLKELALYGGNIDAQVTLDGSGKDLGIDINVKVATLDVGRLARAAVKDGPAIGGIANGSLSAKARGVSARDIVENLSGRLSLDLRKVDIKEAPITALNLALDLPGLTTPPTLKANIVYNKENVAITARLDPLKKILAGDRFAAKLSVRSKLFNAGYDGDVLQKPVPGLDGAFDLDVPSVGKLAAWLGQPLDAKQPDPGPLRIKAVFAGEGAKVALKSATIEGDGLRAEATGSFDGSGAVKKIILDIKSGKLDIDKYLPPVQPASAARGGPKQQGDLLAGLPTEPIDLSVLKGTEADVSIAIGGVKVRGFEVGRIALTTRLKDGKLNLVLSELALYGGNIGAKIALDGSGSDLGVEASLKVAALDVGKLAKAVVKDGPAVGGIANASLSVKARGVSPRDIVENLSGKLSLELGNVDVKDAPITALKVALDLPGLTTPPTLKASVVYNNESVTINARLDPLKKILAGERFAAKFDVASKYVNAGYDGDVLQKPVPGLDGNFDLDIPSVGKLAAWLGQPLDAKQPDPGPLKVSARFAGEGSKVALKSATIQGRDLKLEATGSFDGSGAVKKIILDIKSGKLDIDKYLPPVQEAKAASTDRKPKGDLLAGLSTTPIDLGVLKGTEADISIAIGGIKVRGFEVGRLALTTRLKGGKLNLNLNELSLYDGKVGAKILLDGSGRELIIDAGLRVTKLDVGKLARAVAKDAPAIAGIATVKLSAKARGASPRAIVENLSAKLSLDVGGVDVKDAPITALKLAVTLPGLKSRPSLKASIVYNKERVTITGRIDPLQKVLAGKRFAAKLAVTSRRLKASYDGDVLQKPVPGLDGIFNLDVPSVGKLAAWLGQPLDARQPDPGPLKIKAVFAGEGAKVVLKSATIRGRALRVEAKGSFDGSGAVRKIVLDIKAGKLDIDKYLPPVRQVKSAPAASQQKGDLLAGIPNDPIDLSALKGTEADVSIAIGGIKARGFEVGRIALNTRLKDGKLNLDLSRLSLYGGNVTAKIALDGSAGNLALDVNVKVAKLNVGRLARVVAKDAPAIAGIANATLTATATGATPRAIAENLSARLSLAVGGVRIKAVPITELKVDLDLPGLASPPKVTASVVYNRERVSIEAQLDPVRKILSGERFSARIDLKSKLVSGSYRGAVLQKPVPGLDGDFNLDVTSVGKLAAWLGQPLDARQPDPGPLKIRARFAGDGAKVALKSATIEGKAIKASASGSYDGSRRIPYAQATIDIQTANLNAYLPPSTAQKRSARGAPTGRAQPGRWSDEPIDASALNKIDADFRLNIGSIQYRDLIIRGGGISINLARGVLKATVDKLRMADGIVGAVVRLDASRKVLRANYFLSVNGVEAETMLKTFADSDRLSGKTDVEAEGSAQGDSQLRLVESLNGKGSFIFRDGAIRGINLAAMARNVTSAFLDPNSSKSQKTDFAELGGTYVIRRGVLDNQDFALKSPFLRLTGKGTVDLPPRRMKYRIEPKIVATSTGQGGRRAGGISVPILIEGPWHDLSYKPDLAGVIGGIGSIAKDPTKALDSLKGLLPGLLGLGGTAPSTTSSSPSAPPPQSPPPQDQSAPAPAPLPNPVDTLRKLFKF